MVYLAPIVSILLSLKNTRHLVQIKSKHFNILSTYAWYALVLTPCRPGDSSLKIGDIFFSKPLFGKITKSLQHIVSQLCSSVELQNINNIHSSLLEINNLLSENATIKFCSCRPVHFWTGLINLTIPDISWLFRNMFTINYDYRFFRPRSIFTKNGNVRVLLWINPD